MALLRRGSVRPFTAQALWEPFLKSGIETIVSYGVPLFFLADDGLYIREVQTNRPEEANQGRLGQIVYRDRGGGRNTASGFAAPASRFRFCLSRQSRNVPLLAK